MKRELRPNCSIGLQRVRTAKRSHQKANGITAVRRPARSAKKAGEPPQNSDWTYGLGRKETAYAHAASARPVVTNQFCSRSSRSDVRAPSRSTPTQAPAKTNPAQ